ncbi:MotE family protein [Histidinibacterium aquaticum]|uniref:Magnesium transporter MgtE intracellular domain-containing protein n=1 Tax=Histidinibacterium aquaticum TaxID=2613962 RepID=A0A5J5GQB8_9RHOB|nr:hypothetical protein [Histidinibacterium aquaticum]KAA9009953.1 hypothetical protein F3S47_01430 [Histidinibacterium aquaticum]
MSKFRLLILSLASVGAVKAGLSLSGASFSELGLDLVAAAEAAGSEEAETVEVSQPAEPEACEMPDDIFEAISHERELLAVQKEEAAQRRAEIDLAREQLSIEASQLSDLKAELQEVLAQVEAAHQGDMDRLINLYRNMKPAEAAAIMNELDLEVTVTLLGAMEERDAAPILAQLAPVRAQAISRIIFERARLPGDQRLENIRVE